MRYFSCRGPADRIQASRGHPAVIRSGGELPDAVMVQSDYLPSLTAAKALQSLDTLTPDSILEKGKDPFRLDGKLWAVPFSCDVQFMFYNRKLAPTPPRSRMTLDDLEKTASGLAARGIIPFSFNAYSAYWFTSFPMGFRKTALIERDGGIRIDDAATQRALTYSSRSAEAEDPGGAGARRNDFAILLGKGCLHPLGPL